MSLQSLLHYGFGLHDQDYLKTEYQNGEIIIHIETKEEKLRCSNCGEQNVIRKGKVERRVKTVGIGMKPVFLNGHINRLYCKDCKKTLQEKLSYVDEKKVTPEL